MERSWGAVRQFIQSQRERWEAIFVSDGCTDGSDAVLNELADAENDHRLQVIGYPLNRGKGYAVRTGLLAAHGRYRLFTDIDLAYSFEDILKLLVTLKQGSPVAIASQEHPQSQITLTPQLIGYAYRRRQQSKVFSTVANLLLPLNHGDTQAGLKGMTAEVAQWLLPHSCCNGFGFDCELLTMCRAHDVAVTEVPVTVRLDTAVTTTSKRTMLRMLRELWRIRRQWRSTRVARPEVAVPLRKAA